MDWVVIYTAIIWVLFGFTSGVAMCKKSSGFIAWTITQVISLPIYGRVFGWW